MNGKLRDDVCEQQVAVVLGGRINAGLGEQTWPGKGHETPQFVTLLSNWSIRNVISICHIYC